MDIFLIKTSSADNVSSELLEQFGHKNFSNQKKKTEHCFSYLMLDRILKEVYKVNERGIEFINGKPCLKTQEKFFSISHSGEYILIGFSDYECGVDIEQIKNRNYQAIAERMQFQAETPEDFYKEWTKYEAEYKLGGRNKCKTVFQTSYYNYVITAVSENNQEKFEIYIQNGEKFSNLNIPSF